MVEIIQIPGKFFFQIIFHQVNYQVLFLSISNNGIKMLHRSTVVSFTAVGVQQAADSSRRSQKQLAGKTVITKEPHSLEAKCSEFTNIS